MLKLQETLYIINLYTVKNGILLRSIMDNLLRFISLHLIFNYVSTEDSLMITSRNVWIIRLCKFDM